MQKILEKFIEEITQTRKLQATDFSKKLKTLVDKYNERKEEDELDSSMQEDFTKDIINLLA